MIRKTSLLSPLVVVSMAHPPVSARLQAILSPQRRQRPSRPILLLASLGTAVCAIALFSVPVRAEQTSGLSNGQNNAQKPTTQSQKNSSANEAAMLRKKLDALEQLLIQNQKENARLRQQLRALEAQQHRNAALAKTAAVASHVSAEQIAATQTMLRDLKDQQTLLKTRAAQVETLYRNGMTSYEEVSRAKADESLNRVRIEAAETQFNGLKAGHQPSLKEQVLAELQEHLAEYKAELAVEQETLKLTDTRAKAGLISSSDLADAEAKVGMTKAAIDKLNVQILQANAR